jgi:TrpR-related protein YerC/YecD
MKLEKVLAKINDQNLMLNLLKDLTTPQELKALQERLDIVFLLNQNLSYAEISQKTGASTTTITRVARFLKQENYGGYRWILQNLNNF